MVYQAGITYGHILKQYDYDEFGNLIDAGTFINARLPAPAGPGIDFDGHPIDNPYRYAGYEYIEEVKLYDLNARYYNPEIARFLSQDPIIYTTSLRQKCCGLVFLLFCVRL